MDAASPTTTPVPAATSVDAPVFARIGAPRWTALIVAAAIGFAALGIGSSRLPPSAAPAATLVTATATTVTHLGRASVARPGNDLAAGDTVTVGGAGSATVVLGDGEARLAPGAVIRIDELDADGIALEQLEGHVYHRIAPAAGPYVVRTGSVSWAARGTAFDLDRKPVVGTTLEQVTAIAVAGSILLHEPTVDGTLVEGRQAIVRIGTESPEITTAEVPDGWLGNPWVIENAARDEAEGADPGILAPLRRDVRASPGR